MNKKFLLGIATMLLMAFTLSGCEAMKARKCGECPDFKRKKKKKRYRSDAEIVRTPQFDTVSIFQETV